MSDREMLELAAKAAGYDFRWGDIERFGNDFVDCTDLAYIVDGASLVYWDPLADDGDALRLAVKLRLEFEWWKNGISANHASTPVMPIEHVGDDPCAATRRAIVRAAAELGKASHDQHR